MKTILLIEDDDKFRGLISNFLEGSDYDIRQADSVEAAVSLIEDGTTYSAALVDFWLGRSNAVPLLNLINDKLPNVPIVVISGGGGNVSLEVTKAVSEISGAMHFLQKPFRKLELMSLLSNIL